MIPEEIKLCFDPGESAYARMKGSKSALRYKYAARFNCRAYFFTYMKTLRYLRKLAPKLTKETIVLEHNLPSPEKYSHTGLGEPLGCFIFRLIAQQEYLHSFSLEAGLRRLDPEICVGSGMGKEVNQAMQYHVMLLPDSRMLCSVDHDTDWWRSLQALRWELVETEKQEDSTQMLEEAQSRLRWEISKAKYSYA